MSYPRLDLLVYYKVDKKLTLGGLNYSIRNGSFMLVGFRNISNNSKQLDIRPFRNYTQRR
jgi:hypothetical protein